MVAVGLVAWTRFPANKAKLLRQITGKNYGVVVLRGRGGHIQFKMHDFNIIKYDFGPKDMQKTYLIKQDNLDRIGSIPVIYFNIDDANPITFNPTSDKKVAPENLNSIFMLLKAWIESGVALTQNKLFILVLIILGIAGINLLLTYLNGNTCGAVGDKVNLLLDLQHVSLPSPTPFSLR